MCVYATTDPPGIGLFLCLPASRTSPDARPLPEEGRWHWSHSSVKVTFFHGTKRSHRLPHTPISLLVFYLTFHSHYISPFPGLLLFHLNLPLLSFFQNLSVSLAHLSVLPHVWMLTPPLGPKLFCKTLFDNGANWRYLSDTGTLLLLYLAPMNVVKRGG